MTMFYKNVGEKDVFAKSVHGHWYSFKNGVPVEVHPDDAKHLNKREYLEEAKLSGEEIKKLDTKAEEKKDIALKKAKNLKKDLASARGNIKA